MYGPLPVAVEMLIHGGWLIVPEFSCIHRKISIAATKINRQKAVKMGWLPIANYPQVVSQGISFDTRGRLGTYDEG